MKAQANRPHCQKPSACDAKGKVIPFDAGLFGADGAQQFVPANV